MMRLKQIRKERGVKQTTLCAALGIAQSTLSSWENSIYEPDQNTTLKLADYFGVTVDYLLGRDEPSLTPTPAPTDNTITAERLRALGIDTDGLDNLSDEQLSVIRTTLSALLDSFKKSNK
jgi:transcriptional regulator with XRE-family HTH domain